MSCLICGLKPREFMLFGGYFWYTFEADTRICPQCASWAQKFGINTVMPQGHPW